MWPFLSPINKHGLAKISGVATYTPLCYEHNAEIVVFPEVPVTEDLISSMAECTQFHTSCSDCKIYSGMSALVYPSFTKLKPPQLMNINATAKLLKNPHRNHHDGNQCNLTCVRLTSDKEVVILDVKTEGVITILRITMDHKNWMPVLISA